MTGSTGKNRWNLKDGESTSPWSDEFRLIEKLVSNAPEPLSLPSSVMIVPPGDDACHLTPLNRPVFTTDTHREGVHFKFDWQTPEDIGQKAVCVALSDLAASYNSNFHY